MSTWDSNDLELKPSQVYKKIKVVKNPADLVGWPGKTRSKTWLQLVNYFLFFIKTTSFWFIKKLRLTQVIQLKLITRVLYQANHKTGFKNTDLKYDLKNMIGFNYL